MNTKEVLPKCISFLIPYVNLVIFLRPSDLVRMPSMSESTSNVGDSQCTPLDPVEEKRLRNRCWLEVAGGRYKGRVYGVGHVDSSDYCVESYLQERAPVRKLIHRKLVN
ncbi:unnamed protein product [Sphenostylis stenocarpa]|uniref:Uncharacterized protein n=1 Tax=Sphenostylis stenocarpa TaxID=92480 RepID=A0AA86VR62_9FABA|nr:unnamed protein product [Sphenostylis stenocarpa]